MGHVQCDDGNTVSGDGCSNDCQIERGWRCSGGSHTSPDVCTEICGDGRDFHSFPNECDDGNTKAGDGCSATCTVETGYKCSGGSPTSKDVCAEICGDGLDFHNWANECDDGNTVSGDG